MLNGRPSRHGFAMLPEAPFCPWTLTQVGPPASAICNPHSDEMPDDERAQPLNSSQEEDGAEDSIIWCSWDPGFKRNGSRGLFRSREHEPSRASAIRILMGRIDVGKLASQGREGGGLTMVAWVRFPFVEPVARCYFGCLPLDAT